MNLTKKIGILSTLALMQGCFSDNIIGAVPPSKNSQEVIDHDRAIAKTILDSNGLTLPNSGVPQDAEGYIKFFNVLNLGIKSFSFPSIVKNFTAVDVVDFTNDSLTVLPKGIEQGKWKAIWLSGNKICNPDSATIKYLNQMVDGYKLGRDWQTTQKCSP